MLFAGSKFTGIPLSINNVRKRITKYSNSLPTGFKEVTVDRTLLSGKLYRLAQMESMTGYIPPEVFRDELGGSIMYQRDNIALYEAYKKAFNIEFENKAE